MADIRRYWLVRHLRSDTSHHVLHYRRGRLVASGRGLSYWFSPMSASLEAPTRERIQESRRRGGLPPTRARRREGARHPGERARRTRSSSPEARVAAHRPEGRQRATRGRGERRGRPHRRGGRRRPASHIEAEAKADATRLVEGARLAHRPRAHGGVPHHAPEVLVALAAQELASKLQRIDHLRSPPTSWRRSSAASPIGWPPKELPKSAGDEHRQPARRGGDAAHRVRAPRRAPRHARAGALLPPRRAAATSTSSTRATEAPARPGARVGQAIPPRWRRARIDRADLSRFVFGPEDVVVVVGQDGLVANVAKYLPGSGWWGSTPTRAATTACSRRTPPRPLADLLAARSRGARREVEERTMVEARLDDGQRLLALNEVFIGHRTHQSARYRVEGSGGSRRAVVVGRHRRHRDGRHGVGALDRAAAPRAPAAAGAHRGPRVLRARALPERVDGDLPGGGLRVGGRDRSRCARRWTTRGSSATASRTTASSSAGAASAAPERGCASSSGADSSPLDARAGVS
jgi:hypothetical protein